MGPNDVGRYLLILKWRYLEIVSSGSCAAAFAGEPCSFAVLMFRSDAIAWEDLRRGDDCAKNNLTKLLLIRPALPAARRSGSTLLKDNNLSLCDPWPILKQSANKMLFQRRDTGRRGLFATLFFCNKDL